MAENTRKRVKIDDYLGHHTTTTTTTTTTLDDVDDFMPSREGGKRKNIAPILNDTELSKETQAIFTLTP